MEIIEKETDDDTVGIVVASEWDEEWDGKAKSKAKDEAGPKAKGMVGIVAARLMQTFYKPAVVLAINGDEATGSGRCIEGMNLANSFIACTELLDETRGTRSCSRIDAQD